MVREVPNFLDYQSQVPTCCKCNHAGHFSSACPNKICFNCDQLGHKACECSLPTLCCICKEEGHLGVNCDYSWFFPTIAPTDESADGRVRSVHRFRLHCLPFLIFLLFLNDLLLLSCYPPLMPPHLALMTYLLLTFPRLFHLC